LEFAPHIKAAHQSHIISGCQLLDGEAPSDALIVAAKIRLSMPPKPKSIPAPMNEGPQAFEAFRDAARRILAVPKNALPPDPFKKQKPENKKTNRH